MRVTVLGCGSSGGVPLVGCTCTTCRSENPKNKRSRVSVLIEVQGKNLLIDTSPDLREQALKSNLTRIDAVLYTHDHADHTHGIDDLRSFNFLGGDSIPIYGMEETLNTLKKRFEYAFLPKPSHVWFRPSLTAHLIDEGTHIIQGIQVGCFKQLHGKMNTLGFRIGNFAYSTDVDHLPEEAFAALQGVEYWVVDCLRDAPSHSHSHTERTLEWIARVNPKQACLTHMAHELEYEELSARLPSGVAPAYDGLMFELAG